MKKITIEAFPFSELNKDSQTRVLERYRHINVEEEYWNDYVLDESTKKLESLGYDDVKILYSGFGSQGDGACFTATIDIPKWIKAHKMGKTLAFLLKNYESVNISIKHNYRYYFATSTNVDYEQMYWSDVAIRQELGEEKEMKLDSQISEMVALIEAEREKLGNEIYRELERAYIDYTNDENVIDTIQANGMLFLPNGDDAPTV